MNRHLLSCGAFLATDTQRSGSLPRSASSPGEDQPSAVAAIAAPMAGAGRITPHPAPLRLVTDHAPHEPDPMTFDAVAFVTLMDAVRTLQARDAERESEVEQLRKRISYLEGAHTV